MGFIVKLDFVLIPCEVVLELINKILWRFKHSLVFLHHTLHCFQEVCSQVLTDLSIVIVLNESALDLLGAIDANQVSLQLVLFEKGRILICHWHRVVVHHCKNERVWVIG